MPLRVIYQSDAEDDLDAIFSYVLNQDGSAERAYRYTERIRAYCNSFVTFPHRGTKRDDLYPDIRLIGFERRVTIAFTVSDDTVLIARIFYGGRDIAALFDDESGYTA
jgi:plasmid stabilization system protein ParE